MFEISFLLLLKTIIINILVPIIPGMLFVLLFFGTKFKGIMFYLISFFVGTGVVAFSLFNLQFLWFGSGILEYICLVCLLGIGILVKSLRNGSYLNSLSTLFPNSFPKGEMRSHLGINQKIITILGIIFVSSFVIIAGIFNTNFPSYAVDTFQNWNEPVINIYYDGGVQIYGNNQEILGRGRLGYPIFMPIYKALISHFNGGFNDIYINFWNYLSFILFLIFVFVISWEKTKNLFFSTIPLVLICSLPLVFYHSVEGYFDLACAMYSVFSIYFIYAFLQDKDLDNLALGLLFGFILAHLKNDGLIGYFAGIIITFFCYLMILNTFPKLRKKSIFQIIFFVLWFLLPFIILKLVLGIGYNQATGELNGVIFSFHPEIFRVFPTIFFKEDNFGLVLPFIVFIIFTLFGSFKSPSHKKFLFLAPLIIFLIFIAVFLFTNNYTFALSQLTINRLFTMCFVILFSFFAFFAYDEKY